MNRLHKKCLIASIALHLLLGTALLVGPGFLHRQDATPAEPILTFIPDKLVDAEFSNLGPGPGAAFAPAPASDPVKELQSQAPPAARPPQPEPTPPVTPAPAVTPPVVPPSVQLPPPPERTEKPAEKSAEKIPEKTPPLDPEAPAEKKIKPQLKDPPKLLPKEQPKEQAKPIKLVEKKTPAVNVDLTVKKRFPADAAAEKAKAEARAKADAERRAQRAAQAYQSNVRNSLDAIAQHSSTRTDVLGGIRVGSASGGGGGVGGEIYASYKQVVFSAYVNAWIPPREIEDDSATVETQVTIARDGSVVSSKTSITRRSGIPALDKSVQAALDRVRTVAPFPSTSTDTERTFIIQFSLKAKRALG